VLLYYITDRKYFSGPEPRRCELLLAKIGEAARAGVDYVQLREKDLLGRELEALARQAVQICRETRNQKRTRLLINSRSDIALATGADGVHLPSDDIPPSDARAIWSSRSAVLAVSCHTVNDVRLAESQGADFAVFGPVFEKVGTPLRAGIDALRAACQVGHMPVLAIGGVTLENAPACLEAGAAGIAAIRLFQENEITRVVEMLQRNKNHVEKPAGGSTRPT
jgi:thiamine-phosphate pyrophosphorylase